MAIVTRPIEVDDPDLLYGSESAPVEITDLSGHTLVNLKAPENGWSHDSMDALSSFLDSVYSCGWEAYLDGSWIGGSEV